MANVRGHRSRSVCGSACSAAVPYPVHPRTVAAGRGAAEPGGQGRRWPSPWSGGRWPARRWRRSRRACIRTRRAGWPSAPARGWRPRPSTRSASSTLRPTPGATATASRGWASAPAATLRSSTPRRPGAEAGEKAAALLGARPCATGSYTVVFAREVAAALLSYIAQGLSADAVQKGRSPFAGKLGETVGSALATLADDGLAPGGMATNPFDGEGVPRQRTALLQAGVLEAYLHSSYTARKAGEGAASTGNAERGSYRSAPRVAASNLVLAAGLGHARRAARAGGQRACTWRTPRAFTPASTSSAARSRWASPGGSSRTERLGARCARSPSPPTSCRCWAR